MDTQEYAILHGQLLTEHSLHYLAEKLNETRVIRAEIRQSAHYSSGEYLSVKGSNGHLSLERITSNELLARGDAEDADSLLGDARSISYVLGRMAINHRLEIYDQNQDLFGYLHYDWPHQQDDADLWDAARARFTESTLLYLQQAGWFPGRRINIAPIEQTLSKQGFQILDAATQFWREFDMLDYAVPYHENTVALIQFDALFTAENNYYKFQTIMNQLKQPVCPIGQREFEIMVIDPSGQICAYGEKKVGLYASTADEFIETFSKGHQAQWPWRKKPKSSVSRFFEMFTRVWKQ
jgi:hypothetical protein